MDAKSTRKRRVNTLYEGDIIYLYIDGEGNIHSDGFVDERIGCLSHDEDSEREIPTFEGCLFKVLPKLSYEMNKALNKIKEQFSESSEKYLIMQQQVKVEEEANEAVIRRAEEDGQLVVYGQPIQLQHLRSGKFLTAKSKTLADMDKTSIKVMRQHFLF